jgi:hypothetical protein
MIYRPGLMMNTLMRNIATAVVVLTIQMMAVLMSMRREPLDQLEGVTISWVLWKATQPERRGGS